MTLLPEEAAREWKGLSEKDVKHLMHLLIAGDKEGFDDKWFEITHSRKVERLLGKKEEEDDETSYE